MAERLQCRVTANMQTPVCLGQGDWWLIRPTIEGWTKYTAILKQLTLALSVSQASRSLSIVAFWTSQLSKRNAIPPLLTSAHLAPGDLDEKELGHLIQKGPGAFMGVSSKDS